MQFRKIYNRGFTPLEIRNKVRNAKFLTGFTPFRNRRFLTGFTLVEIMIVIAIIGTLVALAVPAILRARINGNEISAIASCRAIATACQTYYTYGFEDNGKIVHEYPEKLSDFANIEPPYLDEVLAQDEPTKQGYEFTYDFDRNNQTGQTTFTLNADPLGAFTGKRHFFVDVTGVIRANPTEEATEDDLPIE